MTHKPPQGIDAENLIRDKIEAVARMWYATEPSAELRAKLTRGLIEKLEAAIIPALAAPPDPRKDLAALEEALGKLRDAPLAKFLERGYHFNSQDDKSEAMGLGRDLANWIFDAIAQRLAEMRGAKR